MNDRAGEIPATCVLSGRVATDEENLLIAGGGIAFPVLDYFEAFGPEGASLLDTLPSIGAADVGLWALNYFVGLPGMTLIFLEDDIDKAIFGDDSSKDCKQSAGPY